MTNLNIVRLLVSLIGLILVAFLIIKYIDVLDFRPLEMGIAVFTYICFKDIADVIFSITTVYEKENEAA